MAIDTSTIQGYEEMSDAEKLTAVLAAANGDGGVPAQTPSASTRSATVPASATTETEQENTPELTFEERLARLEADLAKKDNQIKKANSEAASYKRQLREAQNEATRQASAAENDNATLLSRISELERERDRGNLAALFSELGMVGDVLNDTVDAAMATDWKTLAANVKSWHNETIRDLKAQKMTETPRPPAGGAMANVTKEEFRKMDLPARMKLAEENPALYKSLNPHTHMRN